MSPYQNIIAELAPDGPNPAGVEASMRLQYRTLGNVPVHVYKEEIEVAIVCEKEEPGYLRETAESYGLLKDFLEWEEKRNQTPPAGMTP